MYMNRKEVYQNVCTSNTPKVLGCAVKRTLRLYLCFLITYTLSDEHSFEETNCRIVGTDCFGPR